MQNLLAASTGLHALFTPENMKRVESLQSKIMTEEAENQLVEKRNAGADSLARSTASRAVGRTARCAESALDGTVQLWSI